MSAKKVRQTSVSVAWIVLQCIILKSVEMLCSVVEDAVVWCSFVCDVVQRSVMKGSAVQCLLVVINRET